MTTAVNPPWDTVTTSATVNPPRYMSNATEWTEFNERSPATSVTSTPSGLFFIMAYPEETKDQKRKTSKWLKKKMKKWGHP